MIGDDLSLSSKFIAEMNENLAGYLDNIEFENGDEISSFAQDLLAKFNDIEVLSKEDFCQKIDTVINNKNLSPPTRNSLQDRLTATKDLYNDTKLYVGVYDSKAEDNIRDVPEKSEALRKLILNKITRVARNLVEFSPKEKQEHIENLNILNNKNKQKVASFEIAKEVLIGSRTNKTSTLTSDQQLQNYEIKQIIEDLDLQDERNLSVDLHEDTPLMIQLMQEDESFFSKYSDVLSSHFPNVEAALKLDKENYKFLPAALLNDPRYIKLAVKNDWRALSTASEKIKSDKSIVLSAYLQDSRALKYASDELKNDENFITSLIGLGNPLVCANPRFSTEKYYNLYSLNLDDKISASPELLANPLFHWAHLSESAEKNQDLVKKAPPQLLQDPEFFKLLFSSDFSNKGQLLRFAEGPAKSNEEVAILAISKEKENRKFLDQSLLDNREFMLKLGS